MKGSTHGWYETLRHLCSWIETLQLKAVGSIHIQYIVHGGVA